MLSAIFGDFIANATQLNAQTNPVVPIAFGFAEQWEEQGGPRRIDMRPLDGKGAGPNLYDQQPMTNGMVRKIWTRIEIRVQGLPAQGPGQTALTGPAALLHNTDDTEVLRQLVIVALNDTMPGDYRYLGEKWNSKGEVMDYGRNLSMFFELEQPIADIQPNLTLATPVTLNLSAVEEAPI